MAKPPADADPEKFRIGKGMYTNAETAVGVMADGVFRIDPLPLPVWAVLIHNAIFIAFFSGFLLLVERFGNAPVHPWLVRVAIIAIGLMTCVGFTAAVWYMFRKDNRLGSWLIYDTRTGRLELPREKQIFHRDEIVCVQYISTKNLQWGGVTNNHIHSELNLVTFRDGQRRRWPMLRSISSARAFRKVLQPLLAHTDLPVMRVKDTAWGWEVTETPYGRGDAPIGTR